MKLPLSGLGLRSQGNARMTIRSTFLFLFTLILLTWTGTPSAQELNRLVAVRFKEQLSTRPGPRCADATVEAVQRDSGLGAWSPAVQMAATTCLIFPWVPIS